MIDLTLGNGTPIAVNPFHIFYIQPLGGAGCQIASSGGASVIVTESMDQVQVMVQRWTKDATECHRGQG